MSEIWKKFKGIFIEEIPSDTTNATSQNNNNTVSKESVSQNDNITAQQSAPTSNSAPIQLIAVEDGKVNDKFMEVLFKAMEAVNTPAFDYFEYKQALNNLASMPMDEATRYKSAFAMAQTMGVNADGLINSANSYLTALKQEEVKFQQAATNQVQSQVGNKQAQIDNFNTVIQQKNEQIKRLQDEIEQHKREMEQLKSDIAQASTKVAQTKADFDVTYQTLVSQIQKDVDNMKSYLK